MRNKNLVADTGNVYRADILKVYSMTHGTGNKINSSNLQFLDSNLNRADDDLKSFLSETENSTAKVTKKSIL